MKTSVLRGSCLFICLRVCLEGLMFMMCPWVWGAGTCECALPAPGTVGFLPLGVWGSCPWYCGVPAPGSVGLLHLFLSRPSVSSSIAPHLFAFRQGFSLRCKVTIWACPIYVIPFAVQWGRFSMSHITDKKSW